MDSSILRFDLRIAQHTGLKASDVPRPKPVDLLHKRRNLVASRGLIILSGAMMIIAAISLYDIYWSFKTQEILYEVEQNPIGRWLIAADSGDVALFMTLKTLGTMIVLGAIPMTYWFKRWWGMTAAIAVSAFQCVLFLYITFGG